MWTSVHRLPPYQHQLLWIHTMYHQQLHFQMQTHAHTHIYTRPRTYNDSDMLLRRICSCELFMYFEELMMCAPRWMEYSWSVKVLSPACISTAVECLIQDGGLTISALCWVCMRVHAGVCASSEGVVVRSQGESCKQHASLIPKLFIFPPVGRAKVCMMQKASAVIILNFSGCTKKTALSKTCKQSSTPSGKGVYIRVASIIPHRDVFLTG